MLAVNTLGTLCLTEVCSLRDEVFPGSRMTKNLGDVDAAMNPLRDVDHYEAIQTDMCGFVTMPGSERYLLLCMRTYREAPYATSSTNSLRSSICLIHVLSAPSAGLSRLTLQVALPIGFCSCIKACSVGAVGGGPTTKTQAGVTAAKTGTTTTRTTNAKIVVPLEGLPQAP